MITAFDKQIIFSFARFEMCNNDKNFMSISTFHKNANGLNLIRNSLIEILCSDL